MSKQKKQKDPRFKKLRWLIGIMLAITILLVGGLFAVFEYFYGEINFNDLKNLITDENDPEMKEFLEYLKKHGLSISDLKFDDDDVLNILLVGTDDQENVAGSRSDSMMIVSLNKRTKQITMTSLLRDSYVYIPGHGSTRLNAAYAYGGIDLLCKTIEYNYKIPIEKYAKVDFSAFKDVITQLGGVTLNLTKEEVKYIKAGMPENYDNENLEEGSCTLDGEQALVHARNRHVGTDFSRTRRQRDIIYAIIHKAKNLSLIEMAKVMSKILPGITTNVTRGEILGMILHARAYMKYDVHSYSLPRQGTYKNKTIRGMQVLEVDLGKNSQFFYDTAYQGRVPDEELALK